MTTTGELPKISSRQLDVLKALRRVGPCDDTRLIEEMQTNDRYRWQSESGIRTRRSELVRKGQVVDTGNRVVLDSGNLAKVWDVATRARSS